MVDEEILDPTALSSVLITQTDLQLRELEVQRQIQLEKIRLEQEERRRVEQLERKERMQKEKIEMEDRLAKEKLLFQETEKERLLQEKENERQFQLKLKEMEIQEKSKPAPLFLEPTKFFDVTKHIRLVPPFQGKKLTNIFFTLKKLLKFKWPKEHWTLLLQSVVIGKAREVYTQLSLEQSADNDKVK